MSLVSWARQVAKNIIQLITLQEVFHLGVLWVSSDLVLIKDFSAITAAFTNMLAPGWEIHSTNLSGVWFGDAINAKRTIYYIHESHESF